MDAADSQALSLWKNVGSGRCLHIVLKWTQPTRGSRRTFIFDLHWVSSSIQFVSCTHLMDAILHQKQLLLPMYSNRHSRLPGIESVEKCRKPFLACLFVLKWSQPTWRSWRTFIFDLHWVGSGIQFVSCTRLTDALA